MSQITGSLSATGSVTLPKGSNESLTLIQISGTYTSVTFKAEGSIDGTNYFDVGSFRVDTWASTNGSISPSDNAEQTWAVPSAGLSNVRARVTAIGSGTAAFNLQADSYFTAPMLPANTNSFGEINLGDNAPIDFGTDTDLRVGHNGTYLFASSASGPWSNSPPSSIDPNPLAAFTIFDDFVLPASATVSDVMAWTAVNDGGTGTNAFQDAAGGVYNVVTAAADNDYHAMASVAENFKFAEGKKLWFEARFKLAEATTNESAWWFGLTDTLTTGGFQDDADGPLASYDGALIWKDEATMLVDFETSNAATQNTTTAIATFVTNTWTRVGFYFDGTATTGVITPYVDVGAGWVAGTPQNITLAGLEEMHMVFGVKAGPTAAAETLQVDYVKCTQLR